MNIYCAIDGTDNDDPASLPPVCAPVDSAVMHNGGHVKAMAMLGFHSFKYIPGTRDSVTGASSAMIVRNAYNWIRSTYDSAGPNARLFLGGFSRGGAAAIVVAHLLKRDNISVQEMYLFDAVDRSFWMDNDKTQVVPSNVVAPFHAVRDSKSKSRRTFGNCGMQSAGGNMKLQPFLTTHGGVGGWPNGQIMVKPEFGPEDYAYTAVFGSLAGPAVAKSDPNQAFIHEHREPFPTTVSPEQERNGQEAALRWMYGCAFSSIGAVA